MASSPPLHFCRVDRGLIPTESRAEEYVQKLGTGEEVALKVVRIRSLQWHKRYWALISDIAPHLTEINISLGEVPAMMPIKTPYDLHTALKLISGHCTTQHIAGTPYVLRIPLSTDFENMDGQEWKELYPKLLDAIHERALPEINIEALRDEFARMAS